MAWTHRKLRSCGYSLGGQSVTIDADGCICDELTEAALAVARRHPSLIESAPSKAKASSASKKADEAKAEPSKKATAKKKTTTKKKTTKKKTSKKSEAGE